MKDAKPRRRSTKKKGASADLLQTVKHPHAAGIDVGAEELVAALPAGCPGPQVRTFSSFTSGLYVLRDWLLEHQIKTVALESTGNYWIPLYAVLEEAGLEVWLVNARHVKGVPGRKTDVCDAQWLQQLHQAGLLRRSFQPAGEVSAMRYLMRHRHEMVQEMTRQVQRMQKVLTEMNLHLHHVFSDLDGQSAQRIIDAILDGERDPAKLAALRHECCRTPLPKVLEALQGNYRKELLFVLGQCQQRRAQILASLQECDAQIGGLCAAVPGEDLPPPDSPRGSRPASRGSKASHKNSPGFAVQQESLRFYGVDLCTADGIGVSTVAVLMSEIGPREQLLKAFKNCHALSSWLGFCPDTRITGGKVIRSKTRKVNSRLGQALRMAAQGVMHSKSEMGQYARRMRARLGKAEGITAVAHKLTRIIYAMIATRTPYDEKRAFEVTPQQQARKIRKLNQQAENLGLRLIPA
jgi:transposase